MGMPIGFQVVESSRISRQLAHEGGNVVSQGHRPPLSPDDTSGNHLRYGPRRPQDHSGVGRNKSMKNLLLVKYL